LWGRWGGGFVKLSATLSYPATNEIAWTFWLWLCSIRRCPMLFSIRARKSLIRKPVQTLERLQHSPSFRRGVAGHAEDMAPWARRSVPMPSRCHKASAVVISPFFVFVFFFLFFFFCFLNGLGVGPRPSPSPATRFRAFAYGPSRPVVPLCRSFGPQRTTLSPPRAAHPHFGN